jgi:hypothetical protein
MKVIIKFISITSILLLFSAINAKESQSITDKYIFRCNFPTKFNLFYYEKMAEMEFHKIDPTRINYGAVCWEILL